jgi:hypothetical protein
LAGGAWVVLDGVGFGWVVGRAGGGRRGAVVTGVGVAVALETAEVAGATDRLGAEGAGNGASVAA